VTLAYRGWKVVPLEEEGGGRGRGGEGEL